MNELIQSSQGVLVPDEILFLVVLPVLLLDEVEVGRDQVKRRGLGTVLLILLSLAGIPRGAVSPLFDR